MSGSTSFPFFGVDVEFPYPNPYTSQRVIMASAMKAYMRRQNALLESPTGTGKTLALLSSALAYQDYVQMNPSNPPKFSSSASSQSDCDEPETGAPQIWYTSRVHEQLKQIITELKKLHYTPQLAYLASRRELCIHRDVLKSGHIERECRNIHRLKHLCVYGAKGPSVPREFRKGGEHAVFTVEEFVDYCRENVRCPYLISREMVKTADLILAPYNYLVDPNIRKQMNLSLTGQILVIDEAHNIENVCRDAAGIKLTASDLTKAMAHADIGDKAKLYPTLADPCNVLYGIFNAMYDFVVEKRRIFEAERGGATYIDGGDTVAVMEQFGLTVRSWPQIQGDFLAIKKADDINTNPDQNNRFPSDVLTSYASSLHGVLNCMFQDNGVHMNDFKVIYQQGKGESENDDDDMIRILCLNPGILFSQLARTSHSVVLSSGTLSPMSTFATELGVTFDTLMSAPHVIDSAQVQCYTLTEGPNKVLLSSTAAALKQNKTGIYTELGVILESLLPQIPDGALMFFPSQRHLTDMVLTLKMSKAWARLMAIKPIFVETDRGFSVKDFKKSVNEGKGGFLLGVHRGKLSEGMDFKDRQARAVFVFGIPFSPFMEPEVALKRKYNDAKLGPKEGDAWYESQAYRTLFQAIGRCIRHSKDYGVVFLIDSRFPREMHRFPKWIRDSWTQDVRGVSDIAKRVGTFYADMAIKFPVVYTDTSFDFKGTFALTCACCTQSICQAAQFTTKSSLFCDSQGFLEAVGMAGKGGQYCLVVKGKNCKQLDAEELPPIWVAADQVTYRPLKCKCGTILGVRIYATTEKHVDSLNDIRILLERGYATQGRMSKRLDEVVEKQKVVTMSKSEVGGQCLLSFTTS